MLKFLLVLLSGSVLTASAATITFQPNAQTVSLGSTATVNVNVSGLTASQQIGAFDLIVDSNSSIITPLSVTFFNDLGNPTSELTDVLLTPATANAAETSLESTATLNALQANQPFSLFSITYKAVGLGTSTLTLGVTPDYLSLGNGKGLDPNVVNGSITVLGTMATTPEPSSLVLLATGLGAMVTTIKRRGFSRG